MKLSYIVPVYKVEKYIDECVQSILSQTMDSYEIILVDDGSPDNCPEICDSYAEKYPEIIRVIHKENGGPAATRNMGLKAAKGDYIFFADSDDYLCEDGVKELYEAAVEFDADVLQTSYFSYEENSGKKQTVKTTFPLNTLLTHEDMERELCFASSKMRIIFPWRHLYKREFLIDNRIFIDERLRMVEEPPFNIEAFGKAKRFVAVDIPVYCYRIRDNSLQRQKYVPDYDKWLYLQWSLKLQKYEENCTPSPVFYEDIAEYTVKSIFPLLLGNIYRNRPKESYAVLKRLVKSEMMQRSFKDCDINKFRSKSLDWIMTWFASKKLYFPAHLICKFILYK